MTDKAIELLTPQEVASLLKISKRSLFRHSQSGKLPEPIKVGGVLRWRQSDIATFIQGNRKESTDE